MKYCTKCGAQLADEAVICVGCGCMTDAMQARTSVEATPTQPQQAVQNLNMPSRLLGLFGFMFNLLAALTVTFLLWSLAWMYVSPYGSVWPDGTLTTFAFICSLPACGFGICCFIKTLTEKLQSVWLFPGIIKFIIGIILPILSLVFLDF